MKEELNNNDKTYFANTYMDSDHKNVAISSDLGGSRASSSSEQKRNDEKDLVNKHHFIYKEAVIRRDGRDSKGKDITFHQYIDGVNASDKLLKYARLSGAYKSNWDRSTTASANTPFPGSLFVDQQKTYKNNPLICNEIYPGLLDELEEEGEDKLKCELAKTCGISWSKLNCD
jgi:hypothetical protein